MKQTSVTLMVAAALVNAPISATLAASGEPVTPVSIHAERLPWLRNIDPRFQSFQIGMSHLTGGETWRSYDSSQDNKAGAPRDFSAVREPRSPADLTNPRLRTLAAGLGPFYLRYGGTTSNSVYFQDNDEARLAKAPEGYTVVLTRAAWKGGLEFARAVEAQVVTGFTVSSGVRDGVGAWTPRMAAPWLTYTRSIGGGIYAAELFNEPNAPEPGRTPKGQSASDFARDFAVFRPFMAQADASVKLVGPGVATLGISTPVPSMDGATAEEYMTANPTPKFDIVSYHFYGAIAERCAPPDSDAAISANRALTEEWLARPDKQFQKHKALRDRYAPGAPIWLTETGAAACGGMKWQPTFLDTFRYLDTEARLARQGLDAIFTHALISGSNGVIDEKTLLPNADYWAALLWRRLMGTGVLDVGPIRPGLHIYAHCLRGTPGGVAVLAINLEQAPAAITLSAPAQLYALTAQQLQSRTVLLNGEPLAMATGDRLPEIVPKRLAGKQVRLAPTSISFIALPGAGNPSCSGGPDRA